MGDHCLDQRWRIECSAGLPSGKTIELVDQGSSIFQGRQTLIENAMCNLIENAIRHTGAQAHICLEVGSWPAFCVSDDGVAP